MSADYRNVLLRNVRLSYAELFKPKAPEPGKEPKFSASFLMNKTTNAADIKLIRDTAKKVALEKWGANQPKNLKICLRDGAEKADTDGYGDTTMFTSASSKTRPQVVDADKVTPIDPSSGKIFSGCYVHALIRLWAQDNEFGKKVNAELKAVMFCKTGKPFGEGAAPVDTEAAFAGVTAEEDDSDEEARRLAGE